MKNFLVETYYTCTFKTIHRLDELNEKSMSAIKIPEEKQGKWRVEEEFINAIRGKEQITRSNFVDSLKYMEFTDAVQESCQTGSRIYLPLV